MFVKHPVVGTQQGRVKGWSDGALSEGPTGQTIPPATVPIAQSE